MATDLNDSPVLELPGGIPLKLCRIPKGCCRLGQRGGEPDEEPVVEVAFPEAFYLGEFQLKLIVPHFRGPSPVALACRRKRRNRRGMARRRWAESQFAQGCARGRRFRPARPVPDHSYRTRARQGMTTPW